MCIYLELAVNVSLQVGKKRKSLLKSMVAVCILQNLFLIYAIGWERLFRAAQIPVSLWLLQPKVQTHAGILIQHWGRQILTLVVCTECVCEFVINQSRICQSPWLFQSPLVSLSWNALHCLEVLQTSVRIEYLSFFFSLCKTWIVP